MPCSNSHLAILQIADHIPAQYFVVKESEDKITVAKDTELVCNGNKLYLEVSIANVGDVKATIGGKDISSVHNIELTTQGLDTYFSSLKNIRFCGGIPLERVSPENKENLIVQTNAENKQVGYSSVCKKILPTLSRKMTNACTSCKSLIYAHRKSLPKESTEPDDAPESKPTTQVLSPNEMVELLKEKAPYLSPQQIMLIESQFANSKDSHARSWDTGMIQLALSIWCRSPGTYREILGSNSLVLPSERTLSRYKNSVRQAEGVNEDMLKWMCMQAKHQALPPEGYMGGLILDEMAIQPDLQIIRRDGSSQLLGFPYLGPEMPAPAEQSLANHVLQFMFHGLTGFRLLVAH